MSVNAANQQPTSGGPSTKADVARSLRELDIIIARLRARAHYGDVSHDEDASGDHFSIFDEMIEIHSTPSGVSLQSDRGWGYGLALDWLSVGAYLRKIMRQNALEIR